MERRHFFKKALLTGLGTVLATKLTQAENLITSIDSVNEVQSQTNKPMNIVGTLYKLLLNNNYYTTRDCRLLNDKLSV